MWNTKGERVVEDDTRALTNHAGVASPDGRFLAVASMLADVKIYEAQVRCAVRCLALLLLLLVVWSEKLLCQPRPAANVSSCHFRTKTHAALSFTAPCLIPMHVQQTAKKTGEFEGLVKCMDLSGTRERQGGAWYCGAASVWFTLRLPSAHPPAPCTHAAFFYFLFFFFFFSVCRPQGGGQLGVVGGRLADGGDGLARRQLARVLRQRSLQRERRPAASSQL